MLTPRELLERALQAFRIAHRMTSLGDAREMRHIAAEYLSLAAEATERGERAAAPEVFDTVSGSA